MLHLRKFWEIVSETWDDTPKTLQAIIILICVVWPAGALVARLVANDEFWESLM